MRFLYCLPFFGLFGGNPYYCDAPQPHCPTGFCPPVVTQIPEWSIPIPKHVSGIPSSPNSFSASPKVSSGPRGLPGIAGKNGRDGVDGFPGKDGADAVVDYDILVSQVLDKLPPMRVLIIQDGVVVSKPREVYLGGKPMCIEFSSNPRKE